MQAQRTEIVETKSFVIHSQFLAREVAVDIYCPKNIDDSEISLLLINDGQDLPQIHFKAMLDGLISSGMIKPLLCVGIHASGERKAEYGTAGRPDYAGRGAKAGLYQQFVLEELLPFIHLQTGIEIFFQKGFAGFSLGGLSALDTVWAYPELFEITGIFSGSLWWRSLALGDGYDDDKHRIMQAIIREDIYKPGLRFYFTTGSLDETADRNNNGIIDSIDDTMAVVEELCKKGYKKDIEVAHINYEDGRHDVATWGRALPQFLLWGWGKGNDSL